MTFARKIGAERPKEIALRDENNEYTWLEVDDNLNRAANGLLEMDLGDDNRIAVFAENSAETAFANLAGLISGASVVPVNFHLAADEVAYILNDSNAKVLFSDANTLERAMDAAQQSKVHTLIAWDVDSQEGVVVWEDWMAKNSPDDPADDMPPLPNLLYTSGTTGFPKGTPLPPTMFAGGETVAEHLTNLAAPIAQGGAGVHLVVGPMYHTGPLSGARGLAGGQCSVILGRFDAEKTLKAIEDYSIGNSVMVPTHFVRLLALPEEVREKYDVSSLIRIPHTGAKCPVDVKRAMIDWWGPVFFDAYGASEVGTTCSITSEEWLEHPGSVGRSVPPFRAIVLDDEGNELNANEEGRLFFEDSTGRGIIYHNAPEKTAEAHIAPGVFTLGEIAYMDDDGYVYITDRFSDMIVSGGVNIYPAEAEQVLIHHSHVLDIACIGVPHPEMGEELKALVIVKNSDDLPDPKDLLDWCRERLSHYKCPRSVEFVSSIGRNTMGKVNKRKLRAPYWEGHE